MLSRIRKSATTTHRLAQRAISGLLKIGEAAARELRERATVVSRNATTVIAREI
jgi:hypothetical protein